MKFKTFIFALTPAIAIFSTVQAAYAVIESKTFITNIQVSNITSSSADISWTTSLPTQTVIEYGTQKNNLAFTAFVNEPLSTQHQTTIIGLDPHSTYYFRIVSQDGKGHTKRSQIGQFTTL